MPSITSGVVPVRAIWTLEHVFPMDPWWSPQGGDGDVLPLGVAVEHPLERVLAADAALLVAAVGLSRKLTESLIDLDPSESDRGRGANRLAEIPRPDVRRQPIMAVVRHPDRVRFVFPRDRHHHGAKD